MAPNFLANISKLPLQHQDILLRIISKVIKSSLCRIYVVLCSPLWFRICKTYVGKNSKEKMSDFSSNVCCPKTCGEVRDLEDCFSNLSMYAKCPHIAGPGLYVHKIL